MSNHDNESRANEGGFRIEDAYQQQLLGVARSIDLDLADGRSHEDLVERLQEAGVERVGWDRWLDADGEAIEIVPPSSTSAGSSDEPKDRTVLYCLTRKETTEDRIERLREGLEAEGFRLDVAGSAGDKYKIVEPAEPEEASDESEEAASDASEPTDIEAMTKEELYEMAQDLEVEGRTKMDKADLMDAVQQATAN